MASSHPRERIGQLIPVLNVPSIDVFITFRCGLRCSHCFVGENLNSHRDMSFKALSGVLRSAHSWHTKEITFLGGEPTLHPRFSDALRLAHDEGYETRIVTNGHLSYQRFLSRNGVRSFVCFSIDGSTAAVHDAIRGQGTFAVLLESINRTKAAGHRVGAIVAVCRENFHDVLGILDLCYQHKVEYVNIHYVTNRGFAKPASTLSIAEWRDVVATMEAAAKQSGLTLRIERTFLDEPPSPFRCAVVDRNNLMFLPDGRVYMCMMFIDVPNSHSFVWDGEGLRTNSSATGEQSLVWQSDGLGCPAMRLVNPEIDSFARRSGKCIQCIYQKELVSSSSGHGAVAGVVEIRLA